MSRTRIVDCPCVPHESDITKKRGTFTLPLRISSSYLTQQCSKKYSTSFSEPPAPPVPKLPSCATTKFGCCWDNSTTAMATTTDLPRSKCQRTYVSRSKKIFDILTYSLNPSIIFSIFEIFYEILRDEQYSEHSGSTPLEKLN